MSAIRTVLRKALGDWTAEKTMTEQVLAMGRQAAPIRARYSRSIDLLPVLVAMQGHNYDGPAGVEKLQTDTMFMWRMMTARRSDCAAG